mgnify:CR=1 FL=1
MPLRYEAAGEARNVATAAISLGSPNRLAGTEFFMVCNIVSLSTPSLAAKPSATASNLEVEMNPGNRLFTVIP